MFASAAAGLGDGVLWGLSLLAGTSVHKMDPVLEFQGL